MLSLTNPPQIYQHSAVRLDNLILAFGGHYHNNPQDEDTREILIYNIDTRLWKKYVTSLQKTVPPRSTATFAVTISRAVFVFDGYVMEAHRTFVWKLELEGEAFEWSGVQVDEAKRPSPRVTYSGWEYGQKMWIFGGYGPSPDGYLFEQGDIGGGGSYTYNNQLLCFDPNNGWENPRYSGGVPSPRGEHGATRVNNQDVWLYGGCVDDACFEDMYMLDMASLQWTCIQTSPLKTPGARQRFSFTVITDSQIILHGGVRYPESGTKIPLGDTWVFDLVDLSWSKYTKAQDHPRYSHIGVRHEHTVYIIGGMGDDSAYNVLFHVKL